MTDIMTIGLEELEIVSGGTVGELENLYKAMSSYGFYLDDYASTFSIHCPGANHVLAEIIEEALYLHLGISADIDLGFMGTGINSKPNKYVDIATGKSLTHSEVINRIKSGV